MSLRETIAEAIKRDTVLDMRTIGYEDCWVEDATVATDGIIAAFATALLDDKVVEAAAKVAHRKFGPRPGLPDRWEEVDAVMQNAIRYDTKDILQSVLAAMGAVTEG